MLQVPKINTSLTVVRLNSTAHSSKHSTNYMQEDDLYIETKPPLQANISSM